MPWVTHVTQHFDVTFLRAVDLIFCGDHSGKHRLQFRNIWTDWKTYEFNSYKKACDKTFEELKTKLTHLVAQPKPGDRGAAAVHFDEVNKKLGTSVRCPCSPCQSQVLPPWRACLITRHASYVTLL
jgi:hypothetical protein